MPSTENITRPASPKQTIKSFLAIDITIIYMMWPDLQRIFQTLIVSMCAIAHISSCHYTMTAVISTQGSQHWWTSIDISKYVTVQWMLHKMLQYLIWHITRTSASSQSSFVDIYTRFNMCEQTDPCEHNILITSNYVTSLSMRDRHTSLITSLLLTYPNTARKLSMCNVYPGVVSSIVGACYIMESFQY